MSGGARVRAARHWWETRRLRTRLTLLYGGLFFAAGSILLWLTYLLTARVLTQQFNMKVISQSRGLPLDVPTKQQVNQVFLSDIENRTSSVLSEMIRSSLVVMIMIGIIALLLAYLVADRALRPLERVTETAQRLSESTLHERIGLRGPHDEVKRLADTFDAMLDRLHRAFDAQRRFIANASHELRTPLAINRTVLEVSLEEPEASADLKTMARALLGTNARYERLIEGLLLLAQSSQELTTRKRLRLDHVVRAALDQLGQADPRSRRRTTAVHEDLRPLTVEGDPLFLERAVFNLVENAVKYNVRDGKVWVSCGADGLTVENTGPPIPPYEVEDLFEPFSRQQGDRVRSARGAGLGLSIVRAIVDAHGGTVTAVARPEGGLRVTIRLPAPPAPLEPDRRTPLPAGSTASAD
ncbi:ATP-binding protein [Microbispora corallina]|uniref:histidine kinase n=1 Tax=Microbispora corallina TaxID=83302 RepID=A0ABQ4GBZ9_9ACTN|nr:HAMP domain-containing sensor histidine kinase [Microbispora corallina]GIH44572.1 two-component sensor histidine kinase [Microbispora corallina]